jgi:uncharacterized membrane protein
MKKEINYLVLYICTVVWAVIIAISVEKREARKFVTKVVKVETEKPDTDWTDVENPQKKAYLEHLYNTSYGKE